MALTLAAAVQTDADNAYRDSVAGKVDAGAGPGLLRIYDGARPASPDDAATGTLLAEVTLTDPAFTNGALGDPAPVNASAAGSATWCRILDSNDTAVMDGDVTGTGGGGELELANVNLAAGQSVDITGGTLS